VKLPSFLVPPFRLLVICQAFENEPRTEDAEGDIIFQTKRRVLRSRESVDKVDRESDEEDPGCLGHPEKGELARLMSDLIEARVTAGLDCSLSISSVPVLVEKTTIDRPRTYQKQKAPQPRRPQSQRSSD
jgi:hypothetical protein